MNSESIISQYFDLLIKQIDMLVEAQLATSNDQDVVQQRRFKADKASNASEAPIETPEYPNADDDHAESDEEAWSYASELLKLENKFMSLFTNFNHKFESNLLPVEQPRAASIKLADQLNQSRVDMLAELSSARFEALQRLEAIKSQLKTRQGFKSDEEFVEHVEAQVFASKFFFIIHIKASSSQDSDQIDSSKNGIYLVQLDFYLNPSQRLYLKEINLRAKSERVYFGEEGFSFDESSRENEAIKIRELNFTIDLENLLICSLKKYLSNLFLDARDVYSMIDVRKQNLLPINSLSEAASFKLLDVHLDLASDKSGLFSNLKSFLINFEEADVESNINAYEIKPPNSLAILTLRSDEKQSPKLYNSFFKNLSQLLRLNLINCDFSNVSSDGLNNLASLEAFLLHSPKNSSHINLENLNNLKWLEVSFSNEDSDVPSIQNVNPNLEALEYELSHVPNSFSFSKLFGDWHFEKLRVARLTFKAEISRFDLDWVNQSMPNLKHLKIGETKIKCLSLGKLEFSSLKRLDLRAVRLESIEGDFSNLNNLESLEISDSECDFKVGMFNGLSDLKSLSLNSVAGMKEPISGLFEALSNLEKLDLSSNQIESLNVAVLAGLVNLHSLNLSGNKLIHLDKHVFDNTPRLERVDLSSNGLNIPPNYFDHLNSLKDVKL